ncbi:winged helix-turn-helix transcriptional regulator [Solihabitans fulvus]|uniref:Winged helix-turn-helix transcriptional regulator n=1 Tax=Solihabitans fulvus TaxID=1892852 RepID=A0A5B2XLQ0_9PSEU|nr:MarR family winged helix-turn-helix transcriptional regulator [Solihabitans fulvus]KAA2264313.1 winged helix-turn-helix transcriptional regulator [Solihabitans fulvus]
MSTQPRQAEGDQGLPTQLLQFPSYLMLQLTKESRRIAGLLGDEDLRVTHVTVLACLAEFGPASQKEISARLRIDASDLVSLLDDLENAGFASRTRDERDRRRYTVDLTTAGRRALRRRLGMAERLNELLFAPLSEQERTQLHDLLLRSFRHHDTQRSGG